MICLKCGFKNPDNSHYCAKCGTSFAQMAEDGAAKEILRQRQHEVRNFNYSNAKVCKKCGTSFESRRRKNSYYLIRWIVSGIAVLFIQWFIAALLAGMMILIGVEEETEGLNYILYSLISGIPLFLYPFNYLCQLIENILGITIVACPKCGKTGESIYYSRCLNKYPLRRNAISGIIEIIYDKVHKYNIFSIFGIILAILNLLSFTPHVIMTIMSKPLEMPYINLMICSAPAMIFFIFGMLCVNIGAQLACMPSLSIRRIPLILSVSGAVLNIVSTMCMTHKALLENISRIISVRDIELTADLLQASMGSVKFGIVFINLLIVVCAYFSYHTEQLVRTRNLNKYNLREE